MQSVSNPTSLEFRYSQVHASVGFYDATHSSGRLIAKGKDVLDLLHRMSTNDLTPMLEGKALAAPTILVNEKARFVDALTVIRYSSEEILIVTSAGKEQAVAAWLDKFTVMEDAKFLPASEKFHQFALYGPRANGLIQNYSKSKVSDLESMSVTHITIDGCPVVLLKAPRIAESGWWIFADQSVADAIKLRLEADVLSIEGAVIDDDLFDLLRIEQGIPKSPNELNEKHNPLETPLLSAVSFTKGCYIGQEVIARLDSYDKVQRHLMGLEFEGSATDVEAELGLLSGLKPGPHIEGQPSFKAKNSAGEEIGELTSFRYSPGREKVIGLAFIRSAHSNPGGKIIVHVSEMIQLPATLVKLPFDV